MINIFLKFLHIFLIIILCGVTLWLCVQSPVVIVFLLVYFLIRRKQRKGKVYDI
jgi:hypothetical protein